MVKRVFSEVHRRTLLNKRQTTRFVLSTATDGGSEISQPLAF